MTARLMAETKQTSRVCAVAAARNVFKLPRGVWRRRRFYLAGATALIIASAPLPVALADESASSILPSPFV